MKLFAEFIASGFFILVTLISAQAFTQDEFKSSLRTFLNDHYRSIERSPVPTGILYDLTLPISGISSFNGSDTAHAASLSNWLQIEFELRKAALVETGLPLHTVFREMGRANNREHVYSLAFLNYRFNRLREGLPLDHAIRMDASGVISVEESALTEQRVFAVSALHAETYRGAETRFHVDLKSLYFSNDVHPLRSVKIDFDDGAGFREVSQRGDVVVRYSEPGRKVIRVRAAQTDGLRLSAKCTFDVVTLTTPNPTETWTMTATIPYNGQYSSGEAYVYLASGHDTLTRPIVISEGFDLYNDMNWDEFYALMNQQNLLETVHAMGYDAIILNYDDATTYVERNALLMEALLERVQQMIDPSRSIALVGPSMGGLTTRYALAYMEINNIPHRVRTWLSLDSPQRGANIPLGLQYWVDFFSSQSSGAAFLRDALNSPAAREMLVAHFTSPPSNTASSDPLRATLLSNFAQIGNYPNLPRKVAVANGSGNMQNSGFNPGDQLIRYEYSNIFVSITGDVWALSNAASQQVFNGLIRIFPFTNNHESVTVQPTWPWDNAPGGTRNSMYQLDTTAVPFGDIVALHDNHCFIPTISSLDLDVQDPFFDIAHASNLYSLTPFDSLYFPAVNQDHVTITPENFWWFINEVCDSLPAPVVVISADGNSAVHLNWSPTLATQSYRIYTSAEFGNWPTPFASTADTAWTDPDLSSLRKFYKVESSASPASMAQTASTGAIQSRVLPR